MASCGCREYSKISCLERVRNIDRFLQTIRTERNQALEILRSDAERFAQLIWSEDSPLCVDNACRSTPCFSCAYCRQIHVLVNLPQNNNWRHVVEQIECGERLGQFLTIERHPNSWRAAQIVRSTFDSKPLLMLDAFTHSLIIRTLVQQILAATVLRHEEVVSGFLCSTNGYIISLNAPLPKPWREHSPEQRSKLAPSLFRQIFDIYEKLAPHRFTHGNPGPNALSVAEDTLLLRDFDAASINTELVRIVSEGPLPALGHLPPLQGTSFRLSRQHVQHIQLLRSIGAPAQDVVEVYAWVLILLADNPTSAALMAHEPSTNVIRQMFTEDDLRDWRQMAVQSAEVPNILDFLVGRSLRADVLQLAKPLRT